MWQARDLQGEDYSVISVIGDGSLTGGMAYEAMNNAARLKSNFIIVLNDNNMSISENVGGMSDYLGRLRTNDAYQELKQGVSDTLKKIPVYGDRVVRRIKKTKSGIKQLFIPGMWFEEMGLTYLGPIDGHDIGRLGACFQGGTQGERTGASSYTDAERQRICTGGTSSGEIPWGRAV